jgi:hypothetical protein
MIPQILPNGRNSHHPKQCAAIQVTLGIRVSGKDQMNERQESQQFHLPIAWESSNNYSCLFRIFQPRNLLTSVEHTECTFCAWVNTADSKSPLIMGIYIYDKTQYCLPWFAMIYHDLSWFTMIYNDLQWFTMIYLLIWWWCSSSQTLVLMSFPHNSELWGSENQGFRPVFSWGIPPQKSFNTI